MHVFVLQTGWSVGVVIATRLVEEEVGAVPGDGQHAPDQEQTLHNQVGGEGVAEEERSAILYCT